MPLQYLRELKDMPSPLTVTEPEAVRKIEMLLAAQLVHARLARASVYSMPHAATVHGITWDGIALLRRLDNRAAPPGFRG